MCAIILCTVDDVSHAASTMRCEDTLLALLSPWCIAERLSGSSVSNLNMLSCLYQKLSCTFKSFFLLLMIVHDLNISVYIFLLFVVSNYSDSLLLLFLSFGLFRWGRLRSSLLLGRLLLLLLLLLLLILAALLSLFLLLLLFGSLFLLWLFSVEVWSRSVLAEINSAKDSYAGSHSEDN